MSWEKLGLLFSATAKDTWHKSHAALPVPLHLSRNKFRVFFSGRDARGRSHISYFDFLLGKQNRVVKVSENACLTLGDLGTFDDSGTTTSCIVAENGKYYCYYSGWSLGKSVPFYFYIGLAIGSSPNKFERVSRSPVLGRTTLDPFLTASPSVLLEDGLWRMWYVSADRWEAEKSGPKHYYHIRYAESTDGINWAPTGRVCIDFKDKKEYAIARPCVIYDNGLYKMWFCARGDSYRIGYAESKDGLDWTRKDSEAGIEPSPTGWDSEMLAYPYVFRHRNELFMLYNGNGYGKSGIGLAVWRP